MRRFRLGFVLVSIALLVPLGLLARRALRSVELERSVRQQAVAERLFDEMERSLSEFLAVEEARPFGEYAARYTPPGESAAALVRSPLADPPAEPFVIGYFQVDPDGRVRFPRDPATSPQAEQARAQIEQTVVARLQSGARVASNREAQAAQAPGSTLELDALASRNAENPAKDLRDEKKKAEGSVSAYDALRALNRGVEQRADRQTKISREFAKQALEPSASTAREDEESAGLAMDGRLAMDRDGAARADRPRRARNEIDRFELSPMFGTPAGPGRLMLHRTVVHETQGYRQGLLLDADRLGSWLREHAIGAELARYASVTFVSDGSEEAGAAADERAYRHRFAEPFEALSARLVLAALPGASGAASIYALAALALGATLLGLAALYRMVAVVLRYAEQRGNFVAAVTHELRTPLTAIRMYGEMLRDGMVPSEAKRDEYHRHITAESERLTRLVNNVLELSRLEKGGRARKLEVGALAPVVREAAELVRPHLEQAGFTLRVEVDGDLPRVRFDRDAVLQVLFNLVDNAVKYADDAPAKEIDLEARRDGDGVRLRVRDRGPGVAPGQLRKVFEPFHRGESELTRRRKGTGLGLALVAGLGAEMGARVSGKNAAEGGFEVEVAFPPASTS